MLSLILQFRTDGWPIPHGGCHENHSAVVLITGFDEHGTLDWVINLASAWTHNNDTLRVNRRPDIPTLERKGRPSWLLISPFHFLLLCQLLMLPSSALTIKLLPPSPLHHQTSGAGSDSRSLSVVLSGSTLLWSLHWLPVAAPSSSRPWC